MQSADKTNHYRKRTVVRISNLGNFVHPVLQGRPNPCGTERVGGGSGVKIATYNVRTERMQELEEERRETRLGCVLDLRSEKTRGMCHTTLQSGHLLY